MSAERTKRGPFTEAQPCACGSPEFYYLFDGPMADLPLDYLRGIQKQLRPDAVKCAACGQYKDMSPDGAKLHDWVTTYTGRKFHYIDPRPEDVDIVDIAHHLANVPRYAGSCWPSYSVGQHSVLLSRHIGDRHALRGLLHDAAEFVMGDMPSPLKRLLPQYKEIELRVQAAIYTRFSLPVVDVEGDLIVKAADVRMLATERRDVTPKPPEVKRDEDVPPFVEKITPWHPVEVARSFLNRFHFLNDGRAGVS